jgi:hypothetical protein
LFTEEVDVHESHSYDVEFTFEFGFWTCWGCCISGVEIHSSLQSTIPKLGCGRELITGDVEAVALDVGILPGDVEEPDAGTAGYVCYPEWRGGCGNEWVEEKADGFGYVFVLLVEAMRSAYQDRFFTPGGSWTYRAVSALWRGRA